MKSFSKKIEFHILQSFPVSCLNRDDVGSPKTAVIGGVTRARVSSQCWKRAVRLSLRDLGVKLGLRTKKIEQTLTEILINKGLSQADSEKGAKDLASKISDDTLVFISDNEMEKFADMYLNLKNDNVELSSNDKKDSKSALEKSIKNLKKEPMNALDIALFGRMIAKATNMNVEAACLFSHAISTHKVSTEIDFFTALDELQSEQGSAHIGISEFSSATYYRYICLDIGQLKQTMGDDEEQIKIAVSSFIKALFLAVPSAKQNTMAAMCPWSYAKILVRDGQAVQIPFETPVQKDVKGGYLSNSIKELENGIAQLENNFGSLFKKVAEFTYDQNKDNTVDSIIKGILDTI